MSKRAEIESYSHYLKVAGSGIMVVGAITTLIGLTDFVLSVKPSLDDLEDGVGREYPQPSFEEKNLANFVLSRASEGTQFTKEALQEAQDVFVRDAKHESELAKATPSELSQRDMSDKVLFFGGVPIGAIVGISLYSRGSYRSQETKKFRKKKEKLSDGTYTCSALVKGQCMLYKSNYLTLRSGFCPAKWLDPLGDGEPIPGRCSAVLVSEKITSE